MSAPIAPAEVRRAELDTLDAVVAIVDAERRRDAPAYRACLHDEVVERVDGELVALGADAATTLAERRWRALGPRHVEVEDISVRHPLAFVRYSLHDPHPDGAEPALAGIGYSVYEMHGHVVRSAAHYVARLGDAAPPEAASASPAPHALRHVPLPLDVRPERSRARGWKMGLVGVASVVLQDAVLATPVVAATVAWGGLRAFAVFACLYMLLALVTSFLTLRLLARRDHGASTRIGSLLERMTDHGAGARALRAGSALGFVLGAYILSAAPTVWALHEFGVRRRLGVLAIVASVIWGVGFVAGYCGAATLVGL